MAEEPIRARAPGRRPDAAGDTRHRAVIRRRRVLPEGRERPGSDEQRRATGRRQPWRSVDGRGGRREAGDRQERQDRDDARAKRREIDGAGGKERGCGGDGQDAGGGAMALAARAIVVVRGATLVGMPAGLAGGVVEDAVNPTLVLGGMPEDRAQDEEGEGQDQTAGLPGHGNNGFRGTGGGKGKG